MCHHRPPSVPCRGSRLALLAMAILLPPSIAVPEPPLFAVEARVGSGVAMGGGAGQMVWRMAPITASALVEVALVEQPWVSATGGVFAEGYGRSGVGLTSGLRLRPNRGHFRVGAGPALIVAPYTAYGGVLSIGTCALVCTDLQVTMFVAGSDVPDGTVATQLQLFFGLSFDAM